MDTMSIHLFEVYVMDQGTGPATYTVLVGVGRLDAAHAMNYAREHTHDNNWWRWRIVTGCKYLGELMGVEG